MKFILTLFAVLATVLPSISADRKTTPAKPAAKEAPMNQFEVTIEGLADADAQAGAKTALSAIKEVKVDTFESGEKECKAVLSTKNRLSRGDINKALKEQKTAKVTGFKAIRPDKDKDKKDAEKDKKDDEKDKDKAKDADKDKAKTGA